MSQTNPNRRTRGTGTVYEQNGDWYGRWTAGGRRTARKLGPTGRGGLTKRQALDELANLIAAADDRRPGGETTVAELADLYLARLEQGNRKPSHIRTARSHLNTWIRPTLGSSAVADVDVDRLAETMTLAGRSAKHVRNVGATLHSVLQIAVKRGDIDRNPVDMADLPKVSGDPTLYFLTRDQLERVLAAAPGEDAPRPERACWPTVRLFILAAAMTGKRHGELDALSWHDLDVSANKIRVNRSWDPKAHATGSTKGNRARVVPLPDRLLAELDAHHKRSVYNQDHALVLCHPHTGKPIESNDLLEWFRRACDRAGVGRLGPNGKPRRLHDLRHTYGTTLAANGVPQRTIQGYLGHKHAATTDIYVGWQPGERDAAVVDAAFGGLQVAYGDNTTQHDPPKTPEIAGN
jgi:integrase